MKNFNIGDKVSALDEDMNGVVTGFTSNGLTVATDDGFVVNFTERELIKMTDNSDLQKEMGRFNTDSVLQQKEIPKPRSFVKEKKVKGEIPPPEFDLHIEKLVKNWRGLSNYDILTIQSETAKRHIEFAIKNRIPKIIFIHGVGEGILKAELDFMLGRYESIDFKDANYQKYGIGATEVIIKQGK